MEMKYETLHGNVLLKVLNQISHNYERGKCERKSLLKVSSMYANPIGY